jgi:hypothetical protein
MLVKSVINLAGETLLPLALYIERKAPHYSPKAQVVLREW